MYAVAMPLLTTMGTMKYDELADRREGPEEAEGHYRGDHVAELLEGFRVAVVAMTTVKDIDT